MKKRIALLLILLVLQISICGCWDYTEYENIAQVEGIAVDFDNSTKETTMTQQYIVPKSTKKSDSLGGSSGETGIVYSAKAKTLFDALSKLQQVMIKRIFYGYLKVFILGEEASRYNLMDIIDLNDRSPVIRDTAYFVVASGNAQKVLSTVDENTAKTSSEIISGLVNNSKTTGTAFPVTIHDVTEMLAIGGWEVAVPRVISTADDIKPEAGQTQDDVFLAEKSEGGLRVSGMAAFKGDKFVGWLNEKESVGLGLIMGKKLTMYQVSQRPAGTDPADILYFRIDSSKGKIKAKLVNGEPEIQVNVSIVADLRKYYTDQGSEFLTPEELTRLEKELEDSIRSDIQAALIRGQNELESDIFGFGFAFFREYPRLWQTDYETKWPDIFPDVPVDVTVKVKIQHTGTNIRKLIVK